MWASTAFCGRQCSAPGTGRGGAGRPFQPIPPGAQPGIGLPCTHYNGRTAGPFEEYLVTATKDQVRCVYSVEPPNKPCLLAPVRFIEWLSLLRPRGSLPLLGSARRGRMACSRWRMPCNFAGDQQWPPGSTPPGTVQTGHTLPIHPSNRRSCASASPRRRRLLPPRSTASGRTMSSRSSSRTRSAGALQLQLR